MSRGRRFVLVQPLLAHAQRRGPRAPQTRQQARRTPDEIVEGREWSRAGRENGVGEDLQDVRHVIQEDRRKDLGVISRAHRILQTATAELRGQAHDGRAELDLLVRAVHGFHGFVTATPARS